MNGTRALRDQLEQTQAELRRAKAHLEKLRAHQEREREALRQELEEARREVAGLRTRLEEAAFSRAVAPRSSQRVLPEPSLTEREHPATALVALARSPASLEAAIPILVGLLKLAPADVRLRLTPWLPAVLARVPVSEAQALKEALRAQGFVPVSCEVLPRSENGWMNVRRFEFEDKGLFLESTQKQTLRVPYSELRLLMKGRRSFTLMEMQDELHYQPEGNRGGSLKLKAVEKRVERVAPFIWVLGKGIRVAFTQNTQFLSLGRQRGFSVHENFLRLMEELQRRASQALVDERLFQLSRLVIPMVGPERSQEFFAELLFQAVDEGLWA